MTTTNEDISSHYSPSYKLSRAQDATTRGVVEDLDDIRRIQDGVITRIHGVESVGTLSLMDELVSTEKHSLVAFALWDLIDHHVVRFQGDSRSSLELVPQPYEHGPATGEYD